MTPILFLLGKRLSWWSSNGAAGLICHFSCSRCGKARVWWRPAGWCWVRPTLQNLSPEPSEETSASMSASEFELQLLLKNCHVYSLEQAVGGHIHFMTYRSCFVWILSRLLFSSPLALVFTGTSSMAVTQWKVPTRRFPCGLQMMSWSATQAVPLAGSTKLLWVLQQSSHWLKTSELLPQISFCP